MALSFQGSLKQVVGIYVLIGLNALANFSLIWATKNFVDSQEGSRLLAWGLGLPLLMVAILIGLTVTDYFIRYHSLSMGEKLMISLRTRMMRAMLKTPYPFFFSHHTGQLSSWLINDLDRIKMGVIRIVVNLGRDPVLVIVLSTTLLYLDRQLALITLGCCLITIPLLMKIAQYTRVLNRRMLDAVGRLMSFQRDSLAAAKTIKAYCSEAAVIHRYHRLNKELKATFLKAFAVSNLSSPVVVLGCGAAFLAVALIGLARVKSGLMTAGTLVAFASSMLLFYRPVASLAGFYNAIHAALGASGNVFHVLDLEPEQRPAGGSAPAYRRELVLDKVSYGYDACQPVLNNVSLTIRAGSSLALVGPNGSGKSTLVAILLGLLRPGKGTLCLDGKNVAHLELSQYRRLFGFVSGDDPIFDDSLFNNVTLFDESIDPQKVVSVLSSVGLEDFIAQQADGILARVGEGGIRISKGQQQKLSLARALIRQPPILILDEATHALDAPSLTLLEQAAETWLGNHYTFICITHNLTVLERFEQVVVMEKGRIAEQGVHDDLLAHGGVYKALYDICHQQQEQGRLV